MMNTAKFHRIRPLFDEYGQINLKSGRIIEKRSPLKKINKLILKGANEDLDQLDYSRIIGLGITQKQLDNWWDLKKEN